MELNTEGRQGVVYFVGTEIENTCMKGERTLFIVGTPDVKEIIKKAEKAKVTHLYFGTSQSFQPKTADDWQKWDDTLIPLLKAERFNKATWTVTLDFGVEYAPDLLEFGWNEYDNFIPMISVKLPYINQFNYNATLKLDDTTWGFSNPGVWCHSLHELQTRNVYTDWREYVGDEVVK